MSISFGAWAYAFYSKLVILQAGLQVGYSMALGSNYSKNLSRIFFGVLFISPGVFILMGLFTWRVTSGTEQQRTATAVASPLDAKND